VQSVRLFRLLVDVGYDAGRICGQVCVDVGAISESGVERLTAKPLLQYLLFSFEQLARLWSAPRSK
jgi:hypothetical protein